MKKRGFLALAAVIFIVTFSVLISEAAEYTVVKGDCLYNISRNLGVEFGQLVKANPLISNPDRIYPGDIVYYEKTAPKSNNASAVVYTVQTGDTLSWLAKTANLKIDYLKKLNPQIKNPDRIFAGEKINFGAVAEASNLKSYDAGLPPVPIEIKYNYTPPGKKSSYASLVGVGIALIILGGLGDLVIKKRRQLISFLRRLGREKEILFYDLLSLHRLRKHRKPEVIHVLSIGRPLFAHLEKSG